MKSSFDKRSSFILVWHLQAVDDLAPIDQHLEKEHQEKTKVKNIQV